jgi:hypothetical protein
VIFDVTGSIPISHTKKRAVYSASAIALPTHLTAIGQDLIMGYDDGSGRALSYPDQLKLLKPPRPLIPHPSTL